MFAAALGIWRSPGDFPDGSALNLSCDTSRDINRRAFGWTTYSSGRNLISFANRQEAESELRRGQGNEMSICCSRMVRRRLMGQLDEITDAQPQSWIGVTESTIEAEMKFVELLVEENGLPKDFAGRRTGKTYRGDRSSPRDA
jgi:hypothetical protein